MSRNGEPSLYSSITQDAETKNECHVSARPAAAMSDDATSETSPLLSHRSQHHQRNQQDENRTKTFWTWKTRSANSIMLLTIFVVAFASFGDQIKDSPETRLFESVICYHYYEKNDPSKIKLGRNLVGPGAIGGVDEMHCKVDAVQDQLATLLGDQKFFDGLPSLLLALPFGWAADRYGRWPILLLNLVQILLRICWSQVVVWNWHIFDIRAVWLGSALSILGGGSPILSALFFAVLADITPSEGRAAAFLRVGAVNLSAYLFMPPLAALLMAVNPWIPYFMGTLVTILACLLHLCTPETLNYSVLPSDEEQDIVAAPQETAATPDDSPTSLFSRCFSALESSAAFLIKDWRTVALISTFATHALIGDIGRLLLQYCSKRYALTFSTATLVLTVRNGAIVLLLFLILPYLTKVVLLKLEWCSQSKDLYLARISLVVSATGWLFVAASPNIPTVIISLIFTSLGTGASLLIRSFLTSILEAHDTGKAYSMISIVDTLGAMFGAPLMAELFARGLALGGAWVGLPFFCVALITGSFAGLLLAVPLKKGEGGARDVL